MNLKQFLNKLFKKNSGNTSDIATYGNLASIPSRSELNNDSEIDRIKEIYEYILKQDKTITSNELHLKEFQEDITMNLKLLMRISLYNDNLELDDEKIIKNLITCGKLKLYLQNIVNTEKEIKYSLVALKELEKKNTKIKYFLNRRSSIKEEINNLLGILCNLNNQKNAIFHKVNACFAEYKTNINKVVKKDQYLEKRYKKLREYVSLLGIEDDSLNYDNIYLKIGALERSLEIYTYQNQSLVLKMRNKLNDNISENELTKLESLFRIFLEFGYDIITDDDIDKLYRIKFNCKVRNIYTTKRNPFLKLDDDDRDFLEYFEYGQCISEIIEDIITDKDGIVSKQFNTHDKNFWDSFKSFMSYNNSYYDCNYILENRIVLAFILSIHNSDAKSFFENYLVNTKKCLKGYDRNIFDLEEMVPIKTIFEIFDSKVLFNLASYFDEEIFIDNNFKIIWLNNLYNLTNNNSMDKEAYYIPEGIAVLARTNLNLDHKTNELISSFFNRKKCKIIYTPRSLKKLSVETFDELFIKKLILNEGLEEFTRSPCSSCLSAKEIIIPTTLIKFDPSLLYYTRTESITINDVSHSSIYSSPDNLWINFLKIFIRNPLNEYQYTPLEYFRILKKGVFICYLKELIFIVNNEKITFNHIMIRECIDNAFTNYFKTPPISSSGSVLGYINGAQIFEDSLLQSISTEIRFKLMRSVEKPPINLRHF